MVNLTAWAQLHTEFTAKGITLVAVSKTKPAEDIHALYDAGQRDFGENYVQELTAKQPALPADIRWHFIGHLQSNKVKYIAPYVHMVHSVDNKKLLQEIDKHAAKNNRKINVLLQFYIAREESKFGMDEAEIEYILNEKDAYKNITFCGLMGMATNTNDTHVVRSEFGRLAEYFRELKDRYFTNNSTFNTCSMGMSGDYELAIAAGSNMVRIGSLLFGARGYNSQ